MKILSNKDTTVKYVYQPGLINSSFEVTPVYTARGQWILLADESLVYEFYIYFSVKNAAGKYIIDYERELNLQCIIDDIYEGASQIAKIRDSIHGDTGKFLKSKVGTFFDVLDFEPMVTISIEREEQSIKRAKGILQLSEMSEEERNLPINKDRLL